MIAPCAWDKYLKLLRNYQGTFGIIARDKNLVATLRSTNKVFLAPLSRMDSNPILSSDIKKCQHNTKMTFEHMLNNKRSYGDMSGIGFNKSMTKGERKRERKMKKQEQNRLSHFMCFKCHEVGHLANGCPNEEKLKLKKEQERLKHVKCFKCRTWGHLTSMCPTKQLVKQQVKPQPKP